MSDPIIRVENLSKRFIISHQQKERYQSLGEVMTKRVGGLFSRNKKERTVKEEFWALRDLNFEIKQGECVGIIGRNGAGKSTLLKILSRITEPTHGKIDIEGRVASLLEVGTGFHPELTGRENIFLNGAILGMSRVEIRKKFDEIVDFAEVEKFLDTPVKRYSSGMYVRLAFAVAAHMEPEILVVDEVLAVGDVQFQKKCLGKMGEVSKDGGRTVLFVSHQMGAVRDLCSSAIYLKGGQINLIGETHHVVTTYLEEAVKQDQNNLLSRTDRKGTGKVVIESVTFMDYATQKKVDTIISGQDILIEFKYQSLDNVARIENVVFGCAVHTRDQQFITPFNNQMACEPFGSLPASGNVYCRIMKFPLMSGEFTAHLGLIINGELSDYVENGIAFKVESGDFFGSGSPNSLNRQGVYIEQRWDLNSDKI